MAGDWLKIEKALPDKWEVAAMAGDLGIDPDAVVGKCLRIWSWFDTHTEDGVTNVTVRALLDRIAGVTGFVQAMEVVHWMESDADSLRMPRFDRHTGESSKKRALSAERTAKSRKKSDTCNASRVTHVTPAAHTNALPEKRREEKNVHTLSHTAGEPEIGGAEESPDLELTPIPQAGFPEKSTVLDYAVKQGWPVESASKFWLHHDQARSNGDRAIGRNWHWWSALEMWVMNDAKGVGGVGQPPRSFAGAPGANGSARKQTINDFTPATEWDKSQTEV